MPKNEPNPHVTAACAVLREQERQVRELQDQIDEIKVASRFPVSVIMAEVGNAMIARGQKSMTIGDDIVHVEVHTVQRCSLCREQFWSCKCEEIRSVVHAETTAGIRLTRKDEPSEEYQRAAVG